MIMMVVTTLEPTMNMMQLTYVPEIRDDASIYQIFIFSERNTGNEHDVYSNHTSCRFSTQSQFPFSFLPSRGLSEVTGMISTTMLRKTVRDIRMVMPVGIIRIKTPARIARSQTLNYEILLQK